VLRAEHNAMALDWDNLDGFERTPFIIAAQVDDKDNPVSCDPPTTAGAGCELVQDQILYGVQRKNT